jgi:ADP-ribose pyrophosphatase YjhB (NUDIX family)
VDRLIDKHRAQVQSPAVLYVDVFPFRKTSNGLEFLVFKRVSGVPLMRTWQPVCGKIEADESICTAFSRQVKNKTGQTPKRLINLDRVSTFYDSYYDAVLMVPAAAAELGDGTVVIDPTLHDEYRWCGVAAVSELLLFKRQIEAVREIAEAEAGAGFHQVFELPVR